jgi:glutathione S-transferase
MTELVFYTNPMSRGRIVRWMLEELGPVFPAVRPRCAPGKSKMR